MQPQFKPKKPPTTYRYDRSLDPALSWDINADRERGEALIARVLNAANLDEARSAAAELQRMSRPFLNWAGKAERQEFGVPTLPLFIHERLSTQAILQSVKDRKRDKQQALALFGDEDLDVSDRLLKAYTHQTNWVNRLILGDSLVVMNSLLEFEGLGGQAQMIYMDPPYGVRFGSNFQPFVRRRDVRHGDDEDLTREPEMIQAYRDTWELGLHSYLTYLRDRVSLCRDLLSLTGSIFVQIGDENLHHVREVLDEVMGAANFVGQIAFQKSSGRVSDRVDAVYDILLWYARDRDSMRFRKLFKERTLEQIETAYNYVDLPDGTTRPLARGELEGIQPLPDGSRRFRPSQLYSQTGGESSSFSYEFAGRVFSTPRSGGWRTNREGLDSLAAANRLMARGQYLAFKMHTDDFPFVQLHNIWTDVLFTAFGTEKLYVVQTSPKVLQRCILMTTDPGDLVLDPTCGSGTTAYVAEQWGRRWITIDTSRVPLALARQRLLTATFPYYELRDASRGPGGGFIYRRRHNQKGEEVGGIVPHITLRSIAQNEPPEEEVLVDRSEVESGVVRVSGPFVVEATIPTAIEVEPAAREGQIADATAETDPISRMLEVLRKSTTLRLTGNQVVTFKNIRRPARAMDLHAEGAMANGNERSVAFVFGPEHGPVTEQLVFAAAKEAYLKNYAHLFVVGFAVQPGASKLIQTCEQVVGLPATYVQATMDLVMADLLKTTRASQVFSVTGAPDVRLIQLKRKNGDGPLYRVELRGLDVFDPVTMQNDHRKGDDVPAWFLDTDYNDLVFRVSQAFFPRTSAWDNLKRALKGAYDDSVWEHLAGTVSEPFASGESRKIAVKVIDDRGNELMVVQSLDESEAER
ncbi:MAG: site-specific DNA-methyltransferase [bacterium]|nr:site-specific DNA-methyltransferase [bacterium]